MDSVNYQQAFEEYEKLHREKKNSDKEHQRKVNELKGIYNKL